MNELNEIIEKAKYYKSSNELDDYYSQRIDDLFELIIRLANVIKEKE